MNAIDKYKIRFLTKAISDTTYKTISSPYDILNQFLTDIRTAEDLNNYLLPVIDSVLNNLSQHEIFISDTLICVMILATESKFYLDPDFSVVDPPEFSLPSSDFKEIAETWGDYLQD